MSIYKGARVLVTGGAGMIGTELVNLLFQEGAVVAVADKKNGFDLTNYDVCKQVCHGQDYIFHLAGVKGNPKMTKERPVDFMAPMLAFDRNMICAAQEMGVFRFLYTSSIAVENPETDKYPAWAKRTGELLCEAQQIQHPKGCEYVVVRPANAYGPHDNFQNPDAMVITSLVGKSLEGKLVQYGDGLQVRDFIHARDIARGMLQAMDRMPKHPVNLCSGKGYFIKDVFNLVSKYSGVPIEYREATGQVQGDKSRVMKCNWEFTPMISLEDGIKEVVEYARKQ